MPRTRMEQERVSEDDKSKVGLATERTRCAESDTVLMHVLKLKYDRTEAEGTKADKVTERACRAK